MCATPWSWRTASDWPLAVTTRPSNPCLGAGGSAAVRIRRAGDELRFDYQEGAGQWTLLHSRPVANEVSANQGGLFVSTDKVESVRVEFDYALLVDPLATSPALTDLAYF